MAGGVGIEEAPSGGGAGDPLVDGGDAAGTVEEHGEGDALCVEPDVGGGGPGNSVHPVGVGEVEAGEDAGFPSGGEIHAGEVRRGA